VIHARTVPLALYEGTLVLIYLAGRLAGWWGGGILPALGAAGMVTVCAVPMLLLWIAARRDPVRRAPRLRAALIAVGVAGVATLVVSSGDWDRLLLAGALLPLVTPLLLATRRPLAMDAAFLLGCYAVPAALLAAAISALR
jgi:hypothetical protein